MSVFGPFYPPTLQALVNHAETLAELLTVRELAPPTDEWARAWMTGRADEVVRFAEHVVGLWREGRLDEQAAGTTLEGYLAFVHEGLGRHLRCKAPSCCVAALVDTTPCARRWRGGGAPARLVVAPGEATAMGTGDGLYFDE